METGEREHDEVRRGDGKKGDTRGRERFGMKEGTRLLFFA